MRILKFAFGAVLQGVGEYFHRHAIFSFYFAHGADTVCTGGIAMIDLYTWTTPNGRKVSVMLEECGIPYEVHPINIRNGDQFKPEYVAICPNSKIPAIVDRDSRLSMFESGAILIHLAEKTGRLLPTSDPGRAKVLEWLMWQMANIGPMLGQANHFANAAPEKIPYAIDRYMTESARLIKVLDDQLARTEYVAGEYSIADIATYPWVSVAFNLIKGAKPDVIGEGKNVGRWIAAIGARPTVQKGMAVPQV
jgi:GST-like protein